MDKSEIKLASLKQQIEALETQVSTRGDNLKSTEAEVFYNYITPLCDRLVVIQNEIENNCNDLKALEKHLRTLREAQLKATLLQAKLKTIFNQNQLPVRNSDQPNPDQNQLPVNISNQPTKLETLLKIQTFLIKQLESIRVSKSKNNVSVAETQYNRIIQLYKRFVQNQMQIESQLVTGPMLDIQQEKSQKIHHDVISAQTKLKNIISSHRSSPSAPHCSYVIQEINSSSTSSDSKSSSSTSSSQATHSMKTSTDTTLLIYYQDALIKEIDSAISKKDQVIGPKEARTLLRELSYAHKKFIRNNEKIQELMTDSDLENQRQISNNVSIEVFHCKLQLTRKIHTNIDGSVSECQFNFS